MRIILGCLIGLVSASAAAASGPYVAVGGEVGRYETQTPTGSYTDTALNGRIGYDFGKYFGLEAEGALNLGGAATFESGSDAEGFTRRDEVTSRYGLFLRGRVPTSDAVTIFARGGLGARQSKFETRSFGTYQFDGTLYDTTRGRKEVNGFFAIGGGAEFALSKEQMSAIRAEFTLYQTYIGGEDQDTDFASDSVASIAYVRRF